MLLGNVMVDTVNAALEQRPKTFNRVRMNKASYIFALAMLYDVMLVAMGEANVALPIIGNESRALLDVPADVRLKLNRVCPSDLLGDHSAVALGYSRNDGFLRGGSANKAFVLPANIGFVGFHCTGEGMLVHGIGTDGVTNPVKHEPSGFLSHANIPMKLKGRNAVLVSRNEVNSHEPLLEGKCGVLENRPHFDRELLLAGTALVQFARLELIDFLGGMTVRALGPGTPTGFGEVVTAGLFIGEPLGDIQKASEFGGIGGHGFLLSDTPNIQHFRRFVKYIIPKRELQR